MGQPDATASLPDGDASDAGTATHTALILVLRADQPLGPSRRFSLDDVDSVTIGRGDAVDARLSSDGGARGLSVTVPDRHISTRHVRLLRVVDCEWVLEDAGSKNGTVLNGTRRARAPLSDGDLIEIGCSFFLYRVFAEAPEDDDAPPPDAFATLSPALAAAYGGLARVAGSALSILLLGQTGVGKEVVARTVHRLSDRRGPFVAVNCGAMPATLVESTMFGHRRGAFSGADEHRVGTIRSADGGTLFLDEIGELPPAAQATLLRVLQEREVVPVGDSRPVPVDVRFVAATNRDLVAEVAAGRFREDLFARVAGLTVRLPPLGARREDLGLLVAVLLRRVAADPDGVRFTPRAARALLRHDWPRNVRELATCLASAAMLAAGAEIDLAHLPPEVQQLTTPAGATPATSAPEESRHRIIALLEAHGGNVSAVARALATSRSQVRRLMRRHGLAPVPPKPDG